MIYAQGQAIAFQEEDSGRWHCVKTTSHCVSPGCHGHLNVLYQKDRNGRKENVFLVCDSGNQTHKYIHKVSIYPGSCQGCGQSIVIGNVIVRHFEKRDKWVHARCYKVAMKPAPIVCYICLKVCEDDDEITKMSNGGIRAYRHTNGCTAHPENQNIVDVEAHLLEEGHEEEVEKRGFEEVGDGDAIRNTDVFPVTKRLRPERLPSSSSSTDPPLTPAREEVDDEEEDTDAESPNSYL
jgi:hypothetical protein